MRLRVLRVLVLLISTALVVVGCGEDSAAPRTQNLSPLRVAIFPAGATLPVYAALTHGIFERNGLRIELTEGQDLPVFMAALAKGQYDIAQGVPTLALIGAEKGLDLQVVASVQQSSRERPNALWITKDGAIDTIGQLRGKTIGVPSLTGIIIDAMVYLLKRDGIERDEVKFVATPFPTMGDQLEAGRVEAVVATNPFGAAIAARGFRVHDDVVVEAVRDASAGAVETAMTSVWETSRTYALEHPETIVAWRESLTEAIDFLNRNESEARMMMRDWLKIPAEVAQGAPLPDWSIEITPQALAPYVVISKAVGSIRTNPDVNSLVWQGP
jgi:NitT/TauT family transport system substrate-binding protein